jgi:Dienelactone hydrolase family
MKPINVLVFGLLLIVAEVFSGSELRAGEDSLPALKDGKSPQTVEELWAGYDPRKEPLETEVLKEWEEDGVVLRVLRYRIGIFKGQKAVMAAIYGFPKGGTKLPGLVQIHGGGQYADYKAPLTNAKRGYATLSIAWAGRLNAPGYAVGPNEVKLFWDGKTNDPKYKLTTDWGAIDAYHSPCRYPENSFASNPPSDHSIDPVASPRNSGWFPCALAARRALTFLEQQPEVDARRLGVYGHSMGGKLTVLTAGSDKRVKAAAPSCGGISDRYNPDALFRATLGDDVYLKNISCPVMVLSPANDFHGRINDLQTAVKEIKSQDWRVTCSPHHNHQDNAEYEVATQLWMDQYLKASFKLPETPGTKLILDTLNGVPSLSVRPDTAKPVLQVDVFYSQQGQVDGKPDDIGNTIARFWHYAATRKQGDCWVADLPVTSIDKPLWVYANVLYSLDPSVSGVGYYYREYTTDRYNLSSLMTMVTADELKTAGVKATLAPSLMIESFAGDWEKEWFRYKRDEWTLTTHKLYSERWKAPEGARLRFEVLAALPNKLVIGIDNRAAEVQLKGGAEWQSIVLAPSDFCGADGVARADWKQCRELRLAAQETLRTCGDNGTNLVLGAKWQGVNPAFRNLSWIAP